MDQMNEDLRVVINRLPHYEVILKKHFIGNSEFRSMCEDYRKCHDALIYWTLMKTRESVGPREEYVALLAELEAEIIQFLDEHSINE
jgi:hypothetical protein